MYKIIRIADESEKKKESWKIVTLIESIDEERFTKKQSRVVKIVQYGRALWFAISPRGFWMKKSEKRSLKDRKN